MSDEDRKRAEALLHEILYGKGNASAILAAFAEERRLERERIFGSVSAGGPIRAAGASAGPAEGVPPAESQGAPTASAIRAEGTPQPEPLREALRAARANSGKCSAVRQACYPERHAWCGLTEGHSGPHSFTEPVTEGDTLAAAPSAQPQPVEINLNDTVWAKVTKLGERVYADHWREFGMEPPPIERDAQGWSKFQLWELANVFGPGMYNGSRVPIETTIRLAPSPAPQASETPADGVRYRAETIDAWSKSYDELCDVLFPESVGKPRMIGWKHLIARASELARSPHGR